MWTCPICGHKFVTKNLWHSCGKYTVADFLKGKPERSVRLFQYFLREHEKIGPITLHPVKTRVAFRVDVRFSGVHRIGRDFIAGGFWLMRRRRHRTIYRVEELGPRCFVHYFRLHKEEDIDAPFRRLMTLAYSVGKREHLRARRRDTRRRLPGAR
jgi:hypothetical protein